MEFGTGLHYLDIGLSLALLVGIFWWTYALTSKTRAQRKLARVVNKSVRQPWSDDKEGGRGNR